MSSIVQWVKSSKFPYSHLKQSRLDDTLRDPRAKRFAILQLLATLLVVLASFYLGRLSSSVYNPAAATPTFKPDTIVFNYNRTFSENTPNTKAAWESLFPPQQGYFIHPTIAPKRSTFSVFHYLHCLNGIRGAYWMSYDNALAGKRLDPTKVPMMVSPPHVRHCLDLLRQALMCNPDLTVEVKDEAAGGVHGFGESHQCINWAELKNWTAEWESYRRG